MDVGGVQGRGVVRVTRGGEVVQEVEFTNLLTTAGDKYFAETIAKHGGGSPNPTAVSGMKLGTGVTAAAKSGGGSALGSYISASNRAFTGGFPTAAAKVGTNTGWNVTYEVTWPAGTATNAAITEVVLVNDSGSNATSSEANTYARATFAAVNKAAGDALTVTWSHTILGA